MSPLLGRPGQGGNSAAAVVSVSHPGDTTYRLHVEVGVTQRLTMRITDMPGWHATADGRPLALTRTDGTLLSALVPGGTTEVVLTYRPALLKVGFALALIALVVMAGTAVASDLVHRRRSRHPD